MAGESDLLLPVRAGPTLVLAVGHTRGIVADRLRFPPVVGERLTGVVRGPSILGLAAPTVTAIVVPGSDRLAAFASLGLILLLAVAGMEVAVRTVRRDGRPTVALATGASLVPFRSGFAFGWILPARFLATPKRRPPFVLISATTLSISAGPVAVRVRIDPNAVDRTVGQLTRSLSDRPRRRGRRRGR